MRRHGRALAVAAAAVLFAGIFALRLAAGDPDQTLGLTYALPVAVVAVALGRTAGLAAAAVGVALVDQPAHDPGRGPRGRGRDLPRRDLRAARRPGRSLRGARAARAPPARGCGGWLPRPARARAGDRLHGRVRPRRALVLREPEDRVHSRLLGRGVDREPAMRGSSACIPTTAIRPWPPRSAARRRESRSTPSTA